MTLHLGWLLCLIPFEILLWIICNLMVIAKWTINGYELKSAIGIVLRSEVKIFEVFPWFLFCNGVCLVGGIGYGLSLWLHLKIAW